MVKRAEADIVTTPTAAANTLIGRFFSGVPRVDVDANVSAIAQQVRQLDVRRRCGSLCDPGCDRPAYNDGTGVGPSGAMVTLCPDWTNADREFRVSVRIHEAAHGNPLQPAEDFAYASTRLITFLTPGDALRNTDSYVLLMRLTHDPSSMRVGPATPDVVTGFGSAGVAPEQPQAERALAWQISDTQAFDAETMHLLADAFSPELTDPGPDADAPVGVPSERDKTRVAAIHDRFSQLYPVVNHSVITLRRATAGNPGGWGRASDVPHVGDTVELPAGFFVLSAAAQVRAMFAMMVHAHAGIPVSDEPKYVRALDLIRTHRRLGP